MSMLRSWGGTGIHIIGEDADRYSCRSDRQNVSFHMQRANAHVIPLHGCDLIKLVIIIISTMHVHIWVVYGSV